MSGVIPTGCRSLDKRLGGGLKEKSITLLYGEAETGKTTLAIQCAVSCARVGCKTIFVDCDNTFFPKRMAEIAGQDFEILASQIILMKPENFEQQALVMENLGDYISGKVRLIVVDTITGLYRERLGNGIKETSALNRELNRQMACLAQAAKAQKVVGLVVGQVRSVIPGGDELVRPVATRVLRFWADTIIGLKPTANRNVIKAEIEERTRKKTAGSLLLRIEGRGLRGCKE